MASSGEILIEYSYTSRIMVSSINLDAKYIMANSLLRLELHGILPSILAKNAEALPHGSEFVGALQIT